MMFEVIDRPVGCTSGTFINALAETLVTGKAIRLPLGDETYRVVRNRKLTSGYALARQRGCKLRYIPSDDGLALVMWLEAKR